MCAGLAAVLVAGLVAVLVDGRAGRDRGECGLGGGLAASPEEEGEGEGEHYSAGTDGDGDGHDGGPVVGGGGLEGVFAGGGRGGVIEG